MKKISTALLSRSALRNNIKVISNHIPKHTMILPMIKANAYGHGDHGMAHELYKLGIAQMGVASSAELEKLLQLGLDIDLYNFGVFDVAFAKYAPSNVVHTLHTADELETFCKFVKERPIRAHVEIDTGMNRFGIPYSQVNDAVFQMIETHLEIEGIYTHYVSSELSHTEDCKIQNQLFQQILDKIGPRRRGLLKAHIANSGGILMHDLPLFDMVRPGISLYGYIEAPYEKLKPLLTWVAPIIQLKWIEKGESVSYGRTFVAPKKTLVATLPVGYGDGYLRAYRDAHIKIHGQRCSIVGNICMDYTMADVTHLNGIVRLGDIAHLIDPESKDGPSAKDLADVVETISYETLSLISPRVERVWTP